MSGRRQAVTAAVLVGLIPLLNLLSAVVVALVILRRGLQEGLLVLLWALLPAALQWYAGDASVVFALVAIVPLAYLLRKGSAWATVIFVTMGFGIALQLSLVWQSGYVALIRETMDTVLTLMQNQGAPPMLIQNGELVPATASQLTDMLLSVYGIGNALVFITTLMTARYCQAMLYNPGGFQAEFHALRPEPRVMLALCALVLAGLAGMPGLKGWVNLLCLAPLLTGLAVVHALAAGRQGGRVWLVLAYLVLLLIPPVIVMLGFADSVVDFRRRYKRTI
ncbi:MAG: hypothetical protein LBF16_03735 [Pseudomonadales bacterium]|nr:hypothetical protein [Pseudomonadales bacterium]